MNKIYKVVWNEVKNCYSVVSEIAKSHGKSSSRRKKTMVALMVFSLLSAGGLSYAEPTLTPDQQAVYDAVLQKLEREKKTVHYVSVNSDSSANPAGSNYNNDGATGNLAMAIGLSATAKGEASTALGRSANAQGLNSVALGFAAKAEGDATTALGFEAKAEGDATTALGNLANAQGNNSMALGYLANAQGNSSTALGFASTTEGESSMALGNLANAQGNSSTALGHKASAYGNQSQATGRNAWAIGGYSQASGYNAVAAAEKGIDAAAYNALSEEEKKNYKLNTTGVYYRTTFKEYTKDEFNALPVMERHILESEQGYTYDKEKQVWRRSPSAVAVGHAAKAIGLSTLAVGDLAEATAKYAVAVGREAEATDVGNTALGYYAKAKGLRSTALGVAALATEYESTAVGPYARAEGKVSLALGSKANAKGNNSIAMGLQSKSIGESSIALGGKAKTQAQGSVAIGMMAESRQKGSVALGEVSLADREAGVWGLDISTGQAMNEDALLGAGKADYDAAKAKLTELQGQAQKLRNDYQASLAQDPVAPNGNHIPSAATQAIGNQLKAKEGEVFAQAIQVNNFVKAWKATTGAVSVGNTELAATRQITGVAAGTEDTDAVNVAQLKALNTKVDKGSMHYFSVKSDDSAKPEGTNWNNDGATGDDAIAAGRYAKAYGNQSQATGRNAWAIGGYSQASGYNAVAAAEKGIDAATYNALPAGEKANYELNEQSDLYYRTKFKEYTKDEFNALPAMERYILESEQGYTYDRERGVWMCSPGAIAIGHAAKAIGLSTLAVGDLAEATGKYAVAVGREAEATDVGNIALGNYAKAKGLRSTALGIATRATDFESMAVGPYAWAEGKVSLALGSNAHAKGNNSIAMGRRSESTGESSIALGGSAKTQAQGSVAIGMMAESRQNGGVALGEVSLADREAGVWGFDISTGKAMNEDALLGAGKADYDAAKAKLTELQGQAQKLRNDYQASLAQDPVAPNGNHIPSAATQAIGNQLKAKEGEVFAQAIQVNNFVKAWKATTGAVSVGNTELAATRQITGVAAGTEDTDAVNVAQLKGVNTKVDKNTTNITKLTTKVDTNTTNITRNTTDISNLTNNVTNLTNNVTNLTTKVDKGAVHNFSVNSGEPANPAGTNWNNDGATGRYATAVGPWAKASSDNSVALGVGTSATHFDSTAVGSFAKAEGAKSAAFGTEAYAKGHTSIAVGPKAESIGKTSIALGGRAKSQADGSVAMGALAESRQDGSVALGAGSLADRKTGVWGLDISTGQAMNEDTLLGAGKAAYEAAKVKLTELQGQAQTLMGEYEASLAQDPIGPNGNPVESAATKAIKSRLDAKIAEVDAQSLQVKSAVNVWQSTQSAISVGNKERGLTRQITGVAAGTEDTDAVNVAQLKKVAAMAKSAAVNIEAGDNVTVSKDANTGTYTISAKDTKLKENANALSISNGKLNLAIEDTDGKKVTGSVDLSSIQGAVGAGKTYTMTGTQDSTNNTTTIALKDNKGNEQKVTVATKDTNTYTTGATYDAGSKKLTFTRNDKKTYDVDLSGIAGSITGDTRNTIVESDTIGVDSTNTNTDGSINYELNVKTNGKVEKDNKGIVSGGTVYKETRVEKDGNYVKKDNTAGNNLSALDKQVGINTQTLGNIESRMGEMDTRVDKVGAGAAALAGLHPLDYDPENKWNFAAGYGHHKGANALAIGAFYRPDENKMISVSGAFGGGENMVSAGVSVKLGQGTGISTSKVAMAKEISVLKEENREMKKEIEVLKEQMQKLLAGK